MAKMFPSLPLFPFSASSSFSSPSSSSSSSLSCCSPDGAAGATPKRRSHTASDCCWTTGGAVATAFNEENSKKLTTLHDRVSRRSLLVKFLTMTLLFLLAVAGLVNFYYHLPGLSGKTRAELAQLLPSSWSESGKLRQLETVRGVFRVFSEYKATHPWTTWFFLCCCYLLYQAFPFFTFTFPGTATLVTLLLGALYPTPVAFITANALAAIGPSAAYFMICFIGKPIVAFLFADKLERLSRILRTKGRTQQRQQQSSSSSLSSSSSRNSSTKRRSSSSGGCGGGGEVWGGVCVSGGTEQDGRSRGRAETAVAGTCSSSRRRTARRGEKGGSGGEPRRSDSRTSSSSSRNRGSGSSSSRGSSKRKGSRCSRKDNSAAGQLLQTEPSFLRPRVTKSDREGRAGNEACEEVKGEGQQRRLLPRDQRKGGRREEQKKEAAAVPAAVAAAVPAAAPAAAGATPRLLKQEEKKKKMEQMQQTNSRNKFLSREMHERSKRFDVDLFLTMLFLRVSPLFPNLVITAAAPLLEVPFDVFFYATLLGLMPNTAVFVSMGSALSSLDSLYGSWKLWGLLCVMGGAVLLLKLLRQRLGFIERAALEEKGGDEELQRER